MSRPLPFDCPRGLSRIQAAAYIGVSATTFDKLVEDGRVPQPKQIGARRVFDRALLDAAFDNLGDGAEPVESDNPWDA